MCVCVCGWVCVCGVIKFGGGGGGGGGGNNNNNNDVIKLLSIKSQKSLESNHLFTPININNITLY